jgi:hypothetical protein
MQVGALRCCECGQDLVGVFDPEEVKEAHVTMSPSCSIARGGQAPDVGGTPKGAYNVRGGLILGTVSLQWLPPISHSELGIAGLIAWWKRETFCSRAVGAQWCGTWRPNRLCIPVEVMPFGDAF